MRLGSEVGSGGTDGLGVCFDLEAVFSLVNVKLAVAGECVVGPSLRGWGRVIVLLLMLYLNVDRPVSFALVSSAVAVYFAKSQQSTAVTKATRETQCQQGHGRTVEQGYLVY